MFFRRVEFCIGNCFYGVRDYGVVVGWDFGGKVFGVIRNE